MKSKFIFALMVGSVLATTLSVSNVQVASAQRGNIQIENGIPKIPGIEFSDEQKEELREIGEEVRDRMGEILTSEQQDTVKAEMEAGGDLKEVIESLNLSKDQEKDLESLRKWQRKEIKKILTNEQKRQIMRMRRQGGRG
ncbi:MAG: hypothetical protein ACFB02_07230 [Mastigocoleus sp.]